jgi:hypothetical protein
MASGRFSKKGLGIYEDQRGDVNILKMFVNEAFGELFWSKFGGGLIITACE